MNREFISCFKDLLKEFLEFKHNSGYKFVSSSYVLLEFDKHCFKRNTKEVKLTRELVETFLQLKNDERITNQACKATVIRQLGKYIILTKEIYDTYLVPPISVKGQNEYIPYIFSDNEIKNLLVHAYKFKTHKNCLLPNMGNCVNVIYAILYSTGMRIGEVLNLKVKDIDLENGIFKILKAKNENERLIPLSNSIKELCIEYMNKSCLNNDDYFINSGCYKHKVHRDNFYRYFRILLNEINVPHKGKGYGPRVHDLRHTFAVNSLKQLSENSEDINASLAYLSVYLGHKSIYETQKYIWLTPSLFAGTLKKMNNYTNFVTYIFMRERYEED